MDDDAHMTYEDPVANAPDMASLDRGKGKGKAVDYPEPQRSVNKDEDMSSEEESEAEDPDPEALDEEEEGLDEISTGNILSGKRTRGKQINFAAAAEKAQETGEFLDDDEEDEDFESAADPEDEEMHD
ncbi:hypothetical protein V8E54_007219 [Elaphomyces granulatus]|jgi:hypothetical protein